MRPRTLALRERTRTDRRNEAGRGRGNQRRIFARNRWRGGNQWTRASSETRHEDQTDRRRDEQPARDPRPSGGGLDRFSRGRGDATQGIWSPPRQSRHTILCSRRSPRSYLVDIRTGIRSMRASRLSSVSAGSAPGGSRTPNLLIRSQMLYPLSYRRRKATLPVTDFALTAANYRLARGSLAGSTTSVSCANASIGHLPRIELGR